MQANAQRKAAAQKPLIEIALKLDKIPSLKRGGYSTRAVMGDSETLRNLRQLRLIAKRNRCKPEQYARLVCRGINDKPTLRKIVQPWAQRHFQEQRDMLNGDVTTSPLAYGTPASFRYSLKKLRNAMKNAEERSVEFAAFLLIAMRSILDPAILYRFATIRAKWFDVDMPVNVVQAGRYAAAFDLWAAKGGTKLSDTRLITWWEDFCETIEEENHGEGEGENQ